MIIQRVKGKPVDIDFTPPLPILTMLEHWSVLKMSIFIMKRPPVLHNISLDIHQGDVISVLGPNGAGKTTLVKHAIGLLKPKSGKS